ncbi:MAG: HD-GYP domain-containing protein [Dissulfurispiraceae bacterium]|jgi:HD-GYP domain-containing protein (c-di-GMP phosphodiesterase class II)|nr:HD-GYP domain-containing protein [Dissulfurispiraceae bacterium]
MAIKRTQTDWGSHKSIPVEMLVVGERLPFDLYAREKGVLKPLFKQGMVFTNMAKEILQERGISETFVENTSSGTIDAYLSKAKQMDDATLDKSPVFKKYSFHKDQHYQIDRKLIIPGTKINFNIYSLDKFDLLQIIEADIDSPSVVEADMASLPGDLVINKSQIHMYNEYISSLLRHPDSAKNLPLNVKPVAMRVKSKMVIKDLLDDPRSGEAIKKSEDVVTNLVDCMLEDNDAIYDLLSLSNYDYYTYTHSVNVAVLSIGLGNVINMSRTEKEELGLGVLLHDIGKSAISQEILNKQGKLDDIEYRIIQNHVIEGQNILKIHKNISDRSMIALMQHHEKLTGKGYPFNLTGRDIQINGRITAIADCYDALTTNRPYKQAISPFNALSIIAKETGNYDPDLLKAFIKMLGKIK